MKLTNPFLTMRNFITANEPAAHPASLRLHRPVSFSPPRPAEAEPIVGDDKTLLLKPLNDEHLIEVYREAKAMRLSDDFIQLIEHALEQRNLPEQHWKTS
ncbi:sporulation histidine kinase inhibitor Sda [Paenibacillus sp. IB182496]|uniref:Sporulation histidine kinase inhibitor Sda n=1 Tax=Paenibacillus sabuli TaxID=2772509 RepID=A0A927BVB5_9BACL|nr:sporulation histidine kinase inhibitor Sda [Paenibacillus sabuli]MBD2847498.1 sporulation histidine kinase inhibitor Sda [Paenibacillus sabuli]